MAASLLSTCQNPRHAKRVSENAKEDLPLLDLHGCFERVRVGLTCTPVPFSQDGFDVDNANRIHNHSWWVDIHDAVALSSFWRFAECCGACYAGYDDMGIAMLALELGDQQGYLRYGTF